MRILPYRTSDDRIDGVVHHVPRHHRPRRGRGDSCAAAKSACALLIDSAVDYAIFTMTADGVVDSWNTGAERMFGYTRERDRRPHVDDPVHAGGPRRRGCRDGARRSAPDRPCRRRAVPPAQERRAVLLQRRHDRASAPPAPRVRQDRARPDARSSRPPRPCWSAHDDLEQRVARAHRRARGRGRRSTKRRRITSPICCDRLVTPRRTSARRIARDLHDQLGQQLTALRLATRARRDRGTGGDGGGRSTGARADPDRSSRDVDFLAWELRPAVLDELGLGRGAAALRRRVVGTHRHPGRVPVTSCDCRG